MKNKKGFALFLAIGFVAVTAAVILGLGVLLNSYMATSTAYKEKEYSIHYANIALEEIKWNSGKKYKKWLYDAAHEPGDDGFYDYNTKSSGDDDTLVDGSVDNPDTDIYNYSSVSTVNFDDNKYQNTYWIKVIDHYIWKDDTTKDIYTSETGTTIPLGRVEGWVRIAEKPDDAASDFSFIYGIFCKGTSFRSADVSLSNGQYIYNGGGKRPKVTYIKASATSGDSLSLSEFSVAVFDGYLNIGQGYNVYGKMHANDYIMFIDHPSSNIEQVAKFHNVLSTSDTIGEGQYDGFVFQRKAQDSNITPDEWDSWVSSHKDETVTCDDGTEISTWGFEDNNGKNAHANFIGDLAKPDIRSTINPKTEMHFRKVRASARVNGVLVEEANVQYMFLDPGDKTVNGDGEVHIYTSGKVYANGEKQDLASGENYYRIVISDLNSKIIFVDGQLPAGETDVPLSICGSEGTPTYDEGYPVTSGIYRTSGIQGLSGVLDGQLSIFSNFDVVLAGDLLYQEFLDRIRFTYKDYKGGGVTYAPLVQWNLIGSPGVPKYNEPNLLGVNAKHDTIIPGDMFNTTISNHWWTNNMIAPYNGNITDRCDSAGTGILSSSSGTISGDGFPDIFTFGLFYAGHRIYGETIVAEEETFDRSNNYVDEKGTWFIYGGLGCSEQVYATVGDGSPGVGRTDYGFATRSYNYDPNLYNYSPPFTIAVESQPVWNWRIVNDYPAGLEEK